MKKNKKIIIIISIVALVLIGVLVLLILSPFDKKDDNKENELDYGADITVSTDDNKINQCVLNLNKDGELDNNSYGTFVSMDTNKVKTLEIVNSAGSFTITSYTPVSDDGETENTEYTLVGFEDYKLQDGTAGSIATAAANLEFTSVVSVDGANAVEYGFDNPRATVTATYEDGTKSIFTVGNDAPQGAGTYIKFGTKDTVYLVASDSISAFLTSFTEMFNLAVNDSPEDANSNFEKLTISGTNFEKDIVLEPNSDGKNSASCILTSPITGYAGEAESSNLLGDIRGVYADSVAMVNPTDEQIKNLGLATPYAKIVAKYPDTTITLIASKPDSENKVYLMVDDVKVVYKISADSVAWVQTSTDKLLSEYVLHPNIYSVANLTINNGTSDYSFEMSTVEETKTDDEGNETTENITKAVYNGVEIKSEYFSTFFQNISMLERNSNTNEKKDKAIFTATYKYNDGTQDVVKFYTSNGNHYVAEVNDLEVGIVNKNFINKLIEQVVTISKNDNVVDFHA